MYARRFFSVLIACIFWLASCALAVCLVQSDFGYPFRTTIQLESTKFAPVAGFAYLAPIPYRYSPLGDQASSSKLIEGASLSGLYSPNLRSVERVGSGIFSVLGGKGLIFSARDNSDPRSNGRHYAVVLALRVSRFARFICISMWVVAMILYFYQQASSVGGAPAWIGTIGNATRQVVRLAGKYPLAVLSIPSVYLLFVYPPIWKDVDALGQLIYPAYSGNILHFPPIYCFLGRIPFLLASWLPGGTGEAAPASIFGEQHPTLLGIYLLIILQHLALIAAFAYVVVSITESLLLRGLFAMILAVCSAFFVYAHSCGSEGLSSATIFTIFGAGIALIRNKGGAHWVIYSGALFLAIGCRQIDLLFVFWLPLTLVVLCLVKRFGGCATPCSANRLIFAGQALLIGFLAIAANIWIARVMIAAVPDQYRTTLGRTLSDRIDRFLDRLEKPERIRLATVVASKTKDSDVRVAIMAQAITGSFYSGTSQVIAQELTRSGVPQDKIGAESDRVILQATLLYFETLHPVLIRVILQDFAAGFTNAGNQKIAYGAFEANKSAAVDRLARPQAWKPVAQWSALDLPYATYMADHVRLDPYINLAGSACLGFLAMLTIGLSLFACTRKKRPTEISIVAICVLCFGAFVYGVNTVCVYYMDRYALPLFAAIVVALLAAIAGQEFEG